MRDRVATHDTPAPADWRVFLQLWPFLWQWKGRVSAALALLVLAKIASLGVPLALKQIVDRLDAGNAALGLLMACVAAYGALRFLSSAFQELRDVVFARVGERTLSTVGVKVFRHLLSLDLEYHLSRRTGAVARDIERGVNGAAFLVRAVVFSVVPIGVELALVVGLLLVQFSWLYAAIALAGIVGYVIVSVLLTHWRTAFVRLANERDSTANSRVVDSLLNVETVKNACAEAAEESRYAAALAEREDSRVRTAVSLAALNASQAAVIALTLTCMLMLAARDTAAGQITLGDFAMINALMIQVFIPLNILGFMYREIRRSLTDLEAMMALLGLQPAVTDAPDAVELAGDGIVFDRVSFGYGPDRQILHDVSFDVPAGHTVAIVGPSGSGKSTLGRLLLRFYDVKDGSVRVGGIDVRRLRQSSLRAAVGVVPQDAPLFNDSLRANLTYAAPQADEAALQAVITTAALDRFVAGLPQGLSTRVGERGLKLSGGERQRVAIARTLLRQPRILLFDEATSSLDTVAERTIAHAMHAASQSRTTLIIAHRLSTVIDAHTIIVLDGGRVVQQGSHADLLATGGLYRRLWEAQQSDVTE